MNRIKLGLGFFATVFEGEGAGGEGAGGEGAGGGSGGKTYTEAEATKLVETKMAEQAKKMQNLLAELQAAQTAANLTKEERAELQTRVETLQNELLTKEELAKKKQEEEKRNSELRFTELQTKFTDLESRYQRETITRAITDSALAPEIDAYDPSQVDAILRPNTRLVEELDKDGKPTGNVIPKVKFPDLDSANKPIVLDLTIPEAVKRMTEIPKYQNLFKGKGTGGLGKTKSGSGIGSSDDAAELAKDPKKYIKARREGTLQLK